MHLPSTLGRNGRTLGLTALLAVGLAAISLGLVGCGEDEAVAERDGEAVVDFGVVSVASEMSFPQTLSRVMGDIERRGQLRLVATVDHAALAAESGRELPPTTLLIFGNPDLGTELIGAERTIGLDLPLKVLVWEAEDGTTFVTYSDPAFLATRHGIEGEDEAIDGISLLVRSIATGA